MQHELLFIARALAPIAPARAEIEAYAILMSVAMSVRLMVRGRHLSGLCGVYYHRPTRCLLLTHSRFVFFAYSRTPTHSMTGAQAVFPEHDGACAGFGKLTAATSPFHFAKQEEEVMAYWQAIDAFKTQLALSKGRKPFSFYDGPPFATGLPHYGHLLAGTVKVR